MMRPFVYFDLGNVLFRFEDGLGELSARLSMPLDLVKTIFYENDDRMCRGELSPVQFLLLFEEASGRESDIIDFTDFWVSHFSHIDSTHKLMKELLGAGHKIGILSNIFPEVYKKLIGGGIIPDLNYSAVVLSCDHGVVKPDKVIYRLATELSGRKPDEIFFVDDSERNIVAARESGWRAARLIPDNPELSIKNIRRELDLHSQDIEKRLLQ